MSTQATRPLDGITVVSLEHAIAAPFCTRQLADMGARVIKIERPGSGDFARGYDERVRGLRAGGDDYLTKPSRPATRPCCGSATGSWTCWRAPPTVAGAA
ncbi:hypothetical protein G6F56_014279 [Rhizopus delemar]|nr:hypothetical protein G6F56_014279 [Rhizopus delemar]